MGEIFHHCETTPCVGPNKDQWQIEVNHMINSREIQSTCCHIGCYQDLGGRNSSQNSPADLRGFVVVGLSSWLKGKDLGRMGLYGDILLYFLLRLFSDVAHVHTVAVLVLVSLFSVLGKTSANGFF